MWVGHGTMLCVVENNEIVTFALQVDPGLNSEDGVCTKVTCTHFLHELIINYFIRKRSEIQQNLFFLNKNYT